MGLQDLDTCIGAYHCESAGVVGGALIDQTAYGNDLPLITGTPVFNTRDGFECMDLDNTYWFEGPSLLLTRGSMAVVAVINGTQADGTLAAVNTIRGTWSAGNFDGVPNNAVDADWFSSTWQRRYVGFFGQSPRLNERGGTSQAGTDFVSGAISLITGAFPGYPAQIQASTNTQAVQTSAFAAGSTACRIGHQMRIGHLKASGGLTGGRYCSLKRVYFFAGNVFDHPDFTTQRAAEIVAWGI
jgi:hypothetical protein